MGAILISCYIVWTWIGIASEQMNLMVCLMQDSASTLHFLSFGNSVVHTASLG